MSNCPKFKDPAAEESASDFGRRLGPPGWRIVLVAIAAVSAAYLIVFVALPLLEGLGSSARSDGGTELTTTEALELDMSGALIGMDAREAIELIGQPDDPYTTVDMATEESWGYQPVSYALDDMGVFELHIRDGVVTDTGLSL